MYFSIKYKINYSVLYTNKINHQFIYGLSHTSHGTHTQILLLQYNEMEMALVVFFRNKTRKQKTLIFDI